MSNQKEAIKDRATHVSVNWIENASCKFQACQLDRERVSKYGLVNASHVRGRTTTGVHALPGSPNTSVRKKSTARGQSSGLLSNSNFCLLEHLRKIG
jgi:hypothetical protein